jgi:hypothetical protein
MLAVEAAHTEFLCLPVVQLQEVRSPAFPQGAGLRSHPW